MSVFIVSRRVALHPLLRWRSVLLAFLFDFSNFPHFYLTVLASIFLRRRQEHQLGAINDEIRHLPLLCLIDLPEVLLDKLLKLDIQAFPLSLVELYQIFLVDRSPVLPLRILWPILMLHDRQEFCLRLKVSPQLHGLSLIRNHG